jgi:hypothetical protein
MIDPKFMDEQLGIDRTKIADRYKQVEEQDIPRQEVPQHNDSPQFDVDLSYGNDQSPEDYYERDEEAQFIPYQEEQDVNADNLYETQPEPQRPVPPPVRPPKLARPGKAFAQDLPIFPGGPYQSQLDAWKKQFGKVFATELETGETYIWRTINRFEYKEVMSIPNTNELTREEMICEVCVLFPSEYSYEDMVNDKGGVPSMLAEQIMQKSGFTRKARVIAL